MEFKQCIGREESAPHHNYKDTKKLFNWHL